MTDGTSRRELVQAVLLDDPAFLREIVERTLQAILEEEMTAHLEPSATNGVASGAGIATGSRRGR